MLSGRGQLVEVDDSVTVLATGTMKKHVSGTAMFSGKNVARQEVEGVAICERRVGRGRAVFVAPDVGSDYSQNPNRRSREVIRRLIGDIALPFTTDAPANVLVTAWRQPGRIAYHLLNQPATMCRRIGREIALSPEEFTPTGPVHIDLPFPARAVSCATPGTEVTFEADAAATRVRIERLEQHAVVVVEG
jgi:hypothetical protein